MKDIVIVGGGLAGLVAAFELSKSNIDFHLLETSNRAGGVIETVKVDNYITETGPHAFNSLSKEMLGLIEELDLKDKLQEALPCAKKRYILNSNELVPIPVGPLDFFKSSILSRSGKITLLEEFFIKKEDKEESVEEFISRRFGREVLKNIIQPFLGGVFAGDVKTLSAKAVFPKLKELELKYNSVLLGFLLSNIFKKSFKKVVWYSLDEGLETLTRELYTKLKERITLNVKDIDISRAKDFFIVNFKVNNKTINYTTNSVLFTTPAFTLLEYSHLFPHESLVENFRIEYAPIATVNQVIDKTKIGKELDGFGFLCVKEPTRKLLGTIWTSAVFPNRAPKDRALLTSYIGGSYYKKIINMNEEGIKNLVTKELCEILKIKDPSHLETIHIKLNKHAIPQYNLGHTEKINQIEQFMDKNYGLFFAGNYLHGISTNDTIKTSIYVAKKINNFLNLQKRKEIKQKASLAPV